MSWLLISLFFPTFFLAFQASAGTKSALDMYGDEGDEEQYNDDDFM